MRVISTSFESEASPEDAFRFIASLEGLETFSGGFLIPAIKGAKINHQGEITVWGPAGLKHKEIVEKISQPKTITFLIYPNALARFLFRVIEEQWYFTKTGQGAFIRRDFLIKTRRNSHLFVGFFSFFFKKAILKHNKKLAEIIACQDFKIHRPIV